MKEMESQIIERIKTYGYTFINVSDPDSDAPDFTYSVGLTQRAWPELLLIGNLPPRLAQYILTEIASKWVAADGPVMGRMDDIIVTVDGTSLPLQVREVDPTVAMRDYTCAVTKLYPDYESRRCVQVLWPDADGVLPIEPCYNTKMTQPLLPEVA